ncbi:MAG: family 1 glycosylhydrolase [Corynebacterium sp.]|nr:family 1 glycosylhydrolase [Corynebacterium sp.]
MFSPATAGIPNNQGGLENFHWGVATSGFQIEGSNFDSNWYRYAQTSHVDGHKTIDAVDNAADFRHRYHEDIANAASLGVNTFRLGIEWARIEPTPGQYNMEEVAYYDDVIQTIRDYGMVPMITMVHYVYPGWIIDNGGVLSEFAAERFTAYTDFITQRWGGNGTMWVTLNEPFIWFAHEHEIGLAKLDDLPAYLDMIERWNAIGYQAAHAHDPAALVGSNFAFMPTITPIQQKFLQQRLLSNMDYVGIDYYYSVSATNLSAIHAAFGNFAAVTPEPEGIYYALQQYHELFPDKPLYIVENGMPTDNAAPRPDGYTRGEYLHDTVYWLQRAKADGIPLIGYNYWSLVDNYEWGSYDSRFGLWTVNIKNDPTLQRIPTDAVDTYRRITSQGGVGADAQLYLQPTFCSFASFPNSCLNKADPNGPRSQLLKAQAGQAASLG